MGNSTIIYVDAYDSFSNNIVALLTQLLDAKITSVKIDDEFADLDAALNSVAAVVVGPGPGHPQTSEDIGLIPQILHITTQRKIPVLGVCLGFQVLCSFGGLPITRLSLPCHGHAKQILHTDDDIFHALGTLIATCYNSLGVYDAFTKELNVSRPCSSGSGLSSNSSRPDSVFSKPQEDAVDTPCKLKILARDADGYIMAIKRKGLPEWGIQFHPESCKSNTACHTILQNWWKLSVAWNQQHRIHLADSVQVTPRRLLLDAERFAFLPDGVLLKYLDGATQTSGTLVDYKTTKCLGSDSQVSKIGSYTSSSTNTVMLESVTKGRHSIYAVPSPTFCRLEHSNSGCKVFTSNNHATSFSMTPTACLFELEKLMAKRQARLGDGSVPFWGGFIGYISYDSGLKLIKVKSDSSPSTPDLSLLWVERSIVVDHVEGTTTVQSIRKNDRKWIQTMVAHIESETVEPLKNDHSGFQETLRAATAVLPNEVQYKSQIAACQEQLRAGNSYELCLTTEAQVTLPAGNSNHLYQNLRRCNPVPFAAYMQLGEMTILSSSPEQFLVWDRAGVIDMIPMKGTVRKTPSMTFERASQILASSKEQAENLMIADLIRHDLYSALGPHADVRVEKLCEVVEYDTVFQLVSRIRAILASPTHHSTCKTPRQAINSGHTALRCSLPPGSMTGAPKRRSCEILSQLEGRSRGVYSGVLGYFDVGGGGDWSVCIRTAFSNTAEDEDGKQTWRIGAGGAITVLSDAESEWQEMQTKLESVLRAFKPS